MTTEFKITAPGWYLQRNGELREVKRSDDDESKWEAFSDYLWSDNGRRSRYEELPSDIVSRAEDWEPSDEQLSKGYSAFAACCAGYRDQIRAAFKAAFPYGPPITDQEHPNPKDYTKLLEERVAETQFCLDAAQERIKKLEAQLAAPALDYQPLYERACDRIDGLKIQLAATPVRKGPFFIWNGQEMSDPIDRYEDAVDATKETAEGDVESFIYLLEHVATYTATVTVVEVKP